MFKSIIDVSSRDTDSLGHVNNTSLPYGLKQLEILFIKFLIQQWN